MNCTHCGAIDERCPCRTTPTMRPGSASTVKQMGDDRILELVDSGLARLRALLKEGDLIRAELLYGDHDKACRDLVFWRDKKVGE